MFAKGMTFVVAVMLVGTPAVGQPATSPVPNFGKITPLPNAPMQPDPKVEYRVAFNITKAAAKPDQVNPSLEKVARYINLLASAGVHPRRGNVLAIVHGPATDIVLEQNAFRRKHGLSNPNLALIRALTEAGVEVHVCGQALAGQQIAQADVFTGVTVDLSALVALTTLELKGWSVSND